MSKRIKKYQKQYLVKKNKEAFELLADKYNWIYHSEDKNTYKVSFVDELVGYRIDIYLSTLSIGLLSLITSDTAWFKRSNLGFLEEILKFPAKYENEGYVPQNTIMKKKKVLDKEFEGVLLRDD